MKNCTYCGRQNDDAAVQCGECGTPEFRPVAEGDTPSQSTGSHITSRRSIFRWTPTAIILGLLAALYAVSAPLNIYIARWTDQQGEQQLSRSFYWGAFWNALVAALCFTTWRLMRLQRRVYFAAGSCGIAAALFIVMRTWVAGLLRGQNPFPVLEVILIWLPLLYVLCFALREFRHSATPEK